MGPKATALVAGIIDRIENRPYGIGRLPMPTVKVIETLRFFVRKGRAVARAAGHDRACGSTLRRRLDEWSSRFCLAAERDKLVEWMGKSR